MSAKRCWECNTTFYSDYGAIYCNVCHQARQTRQANERQARQDRYEAEQAQREAARIQAQHTQALINAENRRIAAINHQTQVIMEGSITSKTAYDRGYKYIDSDFKHNNDANLSIEVNEYGALEWRWNHLYLTDRLNDEFKKGLGDRLNSYKNIYDVIKASAKRIGQGNADGSFPSTYFTLYTGLTIGGIDIKTKAFNSHFTSTLDETTGELKMNWNEPFKNAELNQAYLDGVNEVHWEVNTDEKKNYRLRFEVPKVKAEREHNKYLKRLNKTYQLLLGIFPLAFLFIFWNITSGWGTFISFIALPFIWKYLEKKHKNWQVTYSKNLRS